MKTKDLLEETYNAVTVNKVRSGLTVLGIVIGIASVIALIAVGQGSQNSIQSSIESLGANLILVTPGAQRSFGTAVRGQAGTSQTLTPDDAAAIAQLDGVSAIAPQVSGRYQAVYKSSNANVSVIGTTAAYTSVRNVQVQSGSFITDLNNTQSNRVAVIGPMVLQDLFAPSENASATPDMAIGKIIRLNQQNFTVVGITVSKGGTGFNNADNVIYIPLLTAQHYFLGKTSYVMEVDVQAVSQNVMTNVQNEITNLLLVRHNISDTASADFTVLNQSDIISAISSVSGTFTTLLAAIAAISLVVGGIGIMNMMLTTVTERTREIGLRKAIGAKRKDITMQFLAESVMLTFVGGAIGIVGGWLAASLISYFTSITTSISMNSVLLAFGVSAAIGIIFGYYPARRAAELNPIEALRYE